MTTPDFDCIIANAAIHDGTGADPVHSDVAIRDGRIAAIGTLHPQSARHVIDADGLALAPGFIDVHTHDDRALTSTDMAAKLSQGVTTVVTGNCGVSLAPLVLDRDPPPPLNLLGGKSDYRFPTFAAYLANLEATGIPVNAACLVGHSTLRAAVMDRLDRPATAAEIAAMKALLAEALAAGAIGFSTGLEYPTAAHAPTDEVMALTALCSGTGAIYTTHMRDEGDHVTEALDEAFRIGASANVPVLISHHKCAGLANHGRSRDTLAQIGAAQARQDVSLDIYPYDACSTILRADFMKGARRTLVAWSKPHPEWAGRDLNEVAAHFGETPAETITRLSPAGAIYFDMDEADVQAILQYPSTMVGSDGLPHDTHPHPRLWGSFPRVLGRYARDLKLFPLAEAIHKMTGLSARRFNLAGRGVVAEGAHADLVLFDPASIADTASFESPAQAATGIHTVWVNGDVAWENGQRTQGRTGKVLRRITA